MLRRISIMKKCLYCKASCLCIPASDQRSSQHLAPNSPLDVCSANSVFFSASLPLIPLRSLSWQTPVKKRVCRQQSAESITHVCVWLCGRKPLCACAGILLSLCRPTLESQEWAIRSWVCVFSCLSHWQRVYVMELLMHSSNSWAC